MEVAAGGWSSERWYLPKTTQLARRGTGDLSPFVTGQHPAAVVSWYQCPQTPCRVQERLHVATGEDLLIYKGWETPAKVIRIILVSFLQTADSLLLGIGLEAAAVCSGNRRGAW